jgi:putative hydrolase of the HAD superfamily
MVKVIAFDFGGTLFSTAGMGKFTSKMTEVFIDKLSDQLNFSREQAEFIFKSYVDAWNARRARGVDLPEKEISSADLLQTALVSNGATLDIVQISEILDLFHSCESELFTPLEGVIESLPILVDLGYRLTVVSNNPWAESILTSFRRYQIDSLFEQVIVSCDVGYRKPHRQIFEELVKKIRLEPSEILFVGDSYPHDIETPKLMGMKTCLVDFEGLNKNSQKDYAKDADIFLTQFDKLITAVSATI